MRARTLIVFIVGLMLFLQGCNTFHGAKEGFKEDWIKAREVDDWMRENMW